MENKPLFRDWLTEQLAIAGKSQADLARSLESKLERPFHRSIISNWAVGNHLPEPQTLIEIAGILELEEPGVIDMFRAVIHTLQERKK